MEIFKSPIKTIFYFTLNIIVPITDYFVRSLLNNEKQQIEFYKNNEVEFRTINQKEKNIFLDLHLYYLFYIHIVVENRVKAINGEDFFYHEIGLLHDK